MAKDPPDDPYRVAVHRPDCPRLVFLDTEGSLSCRCGAIKRLPVVSRGTHSAIYPRTPLEQAAAYLTNLPDPVQRYEAILDALRGRIFNRRTPVA